MVAQGLAVAIFVAMFVLIVMDKFGRQYITLGCGALTLIGVFGICMRSVNAIWEIINLRSIFTLDFWYQGSGAAESGIGINWETVIFIACMMIMVEGMARVGFFDWLCMRIAKMVHFNTIPIFITFMIMSAVLAMFIDSITVILFLAAVTIELSSLLKFNPVPMILTEIFCANLGGSSTMCGDPPNIIIGTALKYSFFDFVTNTGVIALLSLIVALAAAVCYGEAAVLRILWMGSSAAMLIRAALEALCAFWMIGLGLSWLRKDWKTPTRSLTPAVLGSAVFYWCVLARFMENSSSWHRVAPTAMVWQLLAGLVFLSALARALYLPGTSDGRTLCAGGLAAFALCLCWELPTVLQTLVQEGGGALLTPTLLFRLGLCCVGALGALSAVRCTRTEQDA